MVFHSLSLIIYAAPTEVVPTKIKSLVSPYVSPLFEQQWSMFAPCPLVEGSVLMNIQHEDGETGWIHPAGESNEWHRIFRMTHHAEIALLEANLVYWINYDKDDFGLRLDQEFDYEIAWIFKEQGHSYYLLQRYIYGVACNMGIKPLSADLKCEMHNVKTGEEGTLYYPRYLWKW